MDQDLPAKKKKNRVVIILLICSLALNLLFIGGLIGRSIFGGPPGHLPNHMGWMLRNLSDEKRKELRPQLKERSGSLRTVRQEMRDARQRLSSAIMEEPLDEKALNLALKDLRSASNKFQVVTHENMSTILKEMKLEDREKALKFLSRREKHRGNFDDRRGRKEARK
ncbi:periplasmic heavy metal sensor [Pseudomonadales bacterium]|nr:periplasmic heavy metal sensor [Pseudomonadales bacterium]MDC3358264.1 periplasmic heavy metal sensor [Pseudomonadales bacterium]MDG1001117.1 periplasmic heavy metal sensor [Pseudomonadales bacterium]